MKFIKIRSPGPLVSSARAGRADSLLRRHVDGMGRVNYAGLGEDALLEDALQGIADQDPRGFQSEREALAFYLNAYNLAALGIAARMAKGDPRFLQQGLRRWFARLHFFFLERVRVARRSRTLFGLEFLTIRLQFKDPRVHFALTCATSSCPPLRAGLYSAERLDQDLEAAARNFVRPSVGYHLDRHSGSVVFNRIFKWYRRDFRALGGPRGALLRWGPPEDVEFVRRHRVKVRYAPYDWGLNGAAGPREVALNGSREKLRTK